jgi:hypothetical protein
MYESLSGLLSKMDLSKYKMVGFGSDGASSMRGIHEGLTAKLLHEVPHLLCIHYVAHHEALAITYASNYFLNLIILISWPIKYILGWENVQRGMENLKV